MAFGDVPPEEDQIDAIQRAKILSLQNQDAMLSQRLAATQRPRFDHLKPMDDRSLQQYIKLLPVPSTVTSSIGISISTSPVPALETAFVAGPILAWRVWRAFPDGALYSVVERTNVPWPAGQPIAASLAPAADNPYGIYAVKSEALMPELRGYTAQPPAVIVRGQVALWGKVIEHEKGYRAEYAYPYLIDLSPPMPGFPQPRGMTSLAAAIRERYGCLVNG